MGLSAMNAFRYIVAVITFMIICTHFLSDYLLPRYMRKRKLWVFIVIAFGVSAVMAVVFSYIDLYFAPQDTTFFQKWSNMMLSSILITANVCGLRFYREHAEMEKKHRELQTAHLEAELKLLRDQVNPHFLFNVINSINVLMRKDVNQASSVLLKFSDMLRHHLYDSSKEYISLKEEINYLQNYVNVEMIRWGNDVQVECNWIEPPDYILIAPFILSPFVENAFKHVSQEYPGGNYVKIRMTLSHTELWFTVENTCDPQTAFTGTTKQVGGIGLENVQKRLHLLYDGKYRLETGRNENVFLVNLYISLQVQEYG